MHACKYTLARTHAHTHTQHTCASIWHKGAQEQRGMNAQGGATLLVDRVDEDANDELEHKETRHYDPQVKKDDTGRVCGYSIENVPNECSTM